MFGLRLLDLIWGMPRNVMSRRGAGRSGGTRPRAATMVEQIRLDFIGTGRLVLHKSGNMDADGASRREHARPR